MFIVFMTITGSFVSHYHCICIMPRINLFMFSGFTKDKQHGLPVTSIRYSYLLAEYHLSAHPEPPLHLH